MAHSEFSGESASISEGVQSILEFQGTVTVPATRGTFVAAEKFLVQGEGGIVSVCRNFTKWFLLDGGKIEAPSGEQTLRYAVLCKSSPDTEIITELGGEERSETKLSTMFFLMESWMAGQKHVFLTNGWANLSYVRDRYNVLRAVSVYGKDNGLYIHADKVTYPEGWDHGVRIFAYSSES